MNHTLTPVMREAARLLALGLGVSEVAARLQVSADEVGEWMRDADVMALFRETVLQSQVVSYARAVEKIGAMMEDESATVVQRAAHEALEQFETAALRMSGQELVVRVEGMPPIGMPGEECDGTNG